MRGTDLSGTMRIANARNGLAFPPYDAISWFRSGDCHDGIPGCGLGVFRHDSMPWQVVPHLLDGGKIVIVDATQHKKDLTDAQRWGVTSWMLTYNLAIGRTTKICDWHDREMDEVVRWCRPETKTAIRKLMEVWPVYKPQPAVVGGNVLFECHRNFLQDDKPGQLKGLLMLQRQGKA